MVNSRCLALLLPLVVAASSTAGLPSLADAAVVETSAGLANDKGWKSVHGESGMHQLIAERVLEEEEPTTIIYERITRINRISPTPWPQSSEGNTKGNDRRQSPSSVQSSANLYETLATLKPIFNFIIQHPGRFLYLALPWIAVHLYKFIGHILYYGYLSLKFTFLDLLFPLLSFVLFPIQILFSPVYSLYSLLSVIGPLCKFFATAVVLGAILGSAAGFGTGFASEMISRQSTTTKQKLKSSFEASTGGIGQWKERIDRIGTPWEKKGKGRETVRIGSEDFGRRKSAFEMPRSRPRTSSTMSYEDDEQGLPKSPSSSNIDTARKSSAPFASALDAEADSPRRRKISSRSSLGPMAA